ncbi:DUF6250 domain-containing protein [Streptomyces sp. NPDC002788]
MCAPINNFWNATDVRSPDAPFDTPRGGALDEYDHPTACYAGYGDNCDPTTGLRRHVGESGVRSLFHDRTETLLVPNQPNRTDLRIWRSTPKHP